MILTEGEDTTTFTGAFEVSSPLALSGLVGMPAQGSVLLGRVDLLDLDNPFDTANLAYAVGDSSISGTGNETPFGFDLDPIFIDVTTTAGPADLLVLSGAGMTPTPYRVSEAFTIMARTPTTLTPGTPIAGTVGSRLSPPSSSS